MNWSHELSLTRSRNSTFLTSLSHPGMTIVTIAGSHKPRKAQRPLRPGSKTIT